MSATLTPLARHARIHQSANEPLAGPAADHAALPWMRSAAGLNYRQEVDKIAESGTVDAAALRRCCEATEYAAGHRDGFLTGIEVGERRGTVRGWYWGALCGAFGTALVALIAGFVIASHS